MYVLDGKSSKRNVEIELIPYIRFFFIVSLILVR